MELSVFKVLFCIACIGLIAERGEADSTPRCFCMFHLMTPYHSGHYHLEGSYNSTIVKEIYNCRSSGYKYCKSACKSRAKKITKRYEWTRKISDDETVGDYVCRKEKMNIDGLYGGVFYKVCDAGRWYYTYKRTSRKLYCKDGKALTLSF